MLVRTISGAVFTIIIAGFFLLREFVDYRLFSILIWFLCAVGTFEVARALKDRMPKIENLFSIILGIIIVPFYCAFKYFIAPAYALSLSISLICLFLIITLIVVLIKYKDKEISNLAFLYPIIFLLIMLECNSFYKDKSFFALLLIFVISPCTDTMAYLVGMIYNKIRKGKAKKLCPRLSPKKTIAGSIGGVIGGVLGALLVYLIFNVRVAKLSYSNPIVFFIVLGFFASIFTQLGDLFESYIKRSVNIKDMGKIMPGHGGVMDRIDGITFASAFVYLMFLIF